MWYLRLLVALGVGIACAASVLAQEDWKSKNVDQWTKEDVEKILNNSEFAKSQEVRLQYESSMVAAAGANIPGNAASANVIQQGSIAPAVSFVFTLRMRSSLAIRLALIRKNQLETDVKKLSDEEFAMFKKRQIGLYECPACADNYVLTLTSRSSENRNFDAVFSAFANARLDDLKGYIALVNDKGEKRPLVNFVPPKRPGDEAIFFFARLNEKNEPLLTKDNKFFVFNVTKNEVSMATNFKVEVGPMVVGEKVEF